MLRAMSLRNVQLVAETVLAHTPNFS